VFEPFFTTKEVGKGTGLGLSICFDIIAKHNGNLEVESKEGEGATFVIDLPLISEKAEGDDADVKPIALVVDDEIDIRKLIAKWVEHAGYTPVLVENGKKALQIVDEKKDQVKLIISDVMMPEMNGVDFATQVRSKFPEMPIVLISGLVDLKTINDQLKGTPVEAILTKPIQREAFEGVVKKINETRASVEMRLAS